MKISTAATSISQFLFEPRLGPATSSEHQAIVRLALKLTATGALAVIAFIPYYIYLGQNLLASLQMTLFLGMLVAFLMIKNDVFSIPVIGILIAYISVMTSLLAVLTSTSITTCFTLLAIAGIGTVLAPQRSYVIRNLNLGLNAFLLFVLYHYGSSFPYQIHLSAEIIERLDNSNVIIAWILIYLQVSRSQRMHQEQNQIIQKANETLFRENQLSKIGVMSATLAHEVNSPLNIIMGHSEQLLKIAKNIEPEVSRIKVEKSATSIHSSAIRISDIVKSLKNMSRKSNDSLSGPAQLKRILQEVYSFANFSAGARGIEVQLLNQLDIELKCNQVQITQILVNLINNSFDAIENQQSQKWVRIQTSVVESLVLIHIIDSGTGIDSKLAERIFDPFFTTKDHEKGTGLGLSIARTFANEHGGNLVLSVSPEGNTRFTLSLPLDSLKSHIAA